MFDLYQAIPDADAVLALEPEELGAKVLFLLRRSGEHDRETINPYNCVLSITNTPHGQQSYPASRRKELGAAVSEAFAWLEAQALLVPEPGSHRGNWKMLSRRAQRFEDQRQFLDFARARQLPKKLLHLALSGDVWLDFMRGKFAAAVFQAMREVEISVRQAGGHEGRLVGKRLMQKAFGEDGPLRDQEADPDEADGLMFLFMGAIASYKNPHSHRNVPMDDAAEAIEIIMLANHLLRIVDARRAA